MNAAGAAAQVCAHCKSRKKKCDKGLPSCKRCVRLRITCRYGTDPQGSGQADQTHASSSWSSAALPNDSVVCTRPHAPTDVLFHCPYMALLLNYSGCQSLNTTPLKTSGLDDVFVAQVVATITAQGDDIRTFIEKYFTTIHCWLPIINKKKFYRRLITLQTAPNAEFAMLLLCVYLSIQLPDRENNQVPTHGALYNMVKFFYSFLQAARKPSLVLVQCGILIAIYEHGQDMSQAAYLSIGTCASMGHALRLHKNEYLEALEGHDSTTTPEEAVRIWWGVIILDRVIALKDPENGYPLAAQHPCHDYTLPLNDDSCRELWNHRSLYPTLMESLSSTVQIGSFGRAAQAAYLLGLVIEFVSTSKSDLSQPYKIVAHLDSSIQHVLLNIFNRYKGSYTLCCDAISMCVSALFMLHQYLIQHATYIKPDSINEEVSRAAIAVSSVMKIVLDTVYNANAYCEGPESLPIQSAHILYQAAMMQICLKNDPSFEENYLQNLDLLQRSLRDCATRWRIADRYADLIEQSITRDKALSG
ncbi:hypothetical protein F5884DRAFT_859763 [Xylogone sp. PMI_703]|nr:hypothetical protein F5884DRAFT_859763 [Xylogone sp. PMI_703]